MLTTIGIVLREALNFLFNFLFNFLPACWLNFYYTF